MITLREAIDGVLSRLGLADGVDVQTYSEEPIREMIIHKVDTLFDTYWWSQFYNPGETFLMDGTTGIVVDDLSEKIKRFEDIRFVWYKDTTDPLPRISYRGNPSTIRARGIAPIGNPQKVFKLYGNDVTGNVTVAYRTKPDDVVEDDDIINFDRQLIILGAAYDYVNGIGTNAGEEDKLANLYEARLSQLLSLQDRHGVDLAPSTVPTYAGGWQELD